MAAVASLPATLLTAHDPEPVGIRNGGASSPFLLICDHAGNAVPARLGELGLDRHDLERHIAYDIGILGVSEKLSDLLGAPLVFQRYSRLVVECNRLFSSDESIALKSDGTTIPANRGLDPSARAQRVTEIVAPYHDEITRRLDGQTGQGEPVILLAMHSFTPSLLSQPFERPWHVGLCFGTDNRFTLPVLAALETEAGLVIGRNEPYGVNMAKDYSVPIHGEGRGLPYAEFEVRQDLITTPAGQVEWAERLARVLRTAHQAFRQL